MRYFGFNLSLNNLHHAFLFLGWKTFKCCAMTLVHQTVRFSFPATIV